MVRVRYEVIDLTYIVYFMFNKKARVFKIILEIDLNNDILSVLSHGIAHK